MEKCPAFEEACSGCGTIGHFKKQCKGGTKGNRSGKLAENKESEQTAEPEGEDSNLNTLHGSWLLMNRSPECAAISTSTIPL